MEEQERIEILKERNELSEFRLCQIDRENTVSEPFRTFFRQTARLLLNKMEESDRICYEQEEIASRQLGVLYGRHLSLLYTKILEEKRKSGLEELETRVIFEELLIQIYNLFEENNAEFISEKQIHDIMYWFFSDYSECFVQEDLRLLKEGKLPPLENRIWALYGDKKYKERYLQAFYLAAEQLKLQAFIPIRIDSFPCEIPRKKMELMLKMREERNQILTQLNEENL